MQNKYCPHDPTKIHYFDDDFEYHHNDSSKMTQLIFDNLKSLEMVFGLKQLDCKNDISSFVLYVGDKKQHIKFYITYVHSIYTIFEMSPTIIEYKCDTIDKVHYYLDTKYPKLRENTSYTQKIVTHV